MPGVGYSSSEKQRPGPLDLCLLFKEVVDVKRATGNGTSIRELLFSSIAEYNRSVNTKVGVHFDFQFPQMINDMFLITHNKSGIPGE